jgi:hypothetical protein
MTETARGDLPAFRFFGGADIRSSLAYDDHLGTKRSLRYFLSLCKRAAMTMLAPRPAVPRCRVAVFPMHRTKWTQIAPLAQAFGTDPLFILAAWKEERVDVFNRAIQAGKDPWVYFRPAYPVRFVWHLSSCLPVLAALALRDPRQAMRRLAQYVELYGLAYGMHRILRGAGAGVLLSAYEDSWYSSTVSQVARKSGIATVNVMHGSWYPHDQYFDYSLVFGEYHKEQLEQRTASRSRFVVAGSATIRNREVPSKFGLSRRILFFDQPSGGNFPAAMKQKTCDMLRSALDAGYSVSVKAHPVGPDAILRGFLERHPEAALLPHPDNAPLEEILSRFGTALTSFSTAGLEAVVNGSPTLFLNPGGGIKVGPLAYMGEFSVTDSGSLLARLQEQCASEEAFQAVLRRELEVVSRVFALVPFDYRRFLVESGLSPLAGT